MKIYLLWLACLPIWLFGCQDRNLDSFGYLATARPTVLLSLNDGESGSLVSNADGVVNIPDSITVIRLFNDRPPEIKTVYETVPNSIIGPPYAAIVRNFGIVINHDFRLKPVSPEVTGRNQIASIDLNSEDLPVISRIELETQPWHVAAHPDRRRAIVALTDHWRVLEVQENGSLIEVAQSPSPGIVYSFDISINGETVIAAMSNSIDFAQLGIFRFRINEDNTISLVDEITSTRFKIDGPFAPRISPNGTHALVLNSLGTSDGKLDDVLLIDLSNNCVSASVRQVGDGLESLAFHPSGQFAVVSCLNLIEPMNTSHLAVIDLKDNQASILYHLPIERIPEGIEFAADGTMLFVGSTFANHITVFEVQGIQLARNPNILPTGHGPSAMGIMEH